MFSYSCHRFLLLQEICHRDLKLENTLLDGSTTPRLKICDFGYSKVFFLTMILTSMIQFPCYLFVIGSFTFLFAMQSGLLHSQPKSTVGTPAYIAPEVLSRKEYDGKVWTFHEFSLYFLVSTIPHFSLICYVSIYISYIDCRCMVMWSHTVCNVGRSLSFRGSRRS